MRIKEVIKDKGMTVSSLAEKMGIKQESLSRAINGNPTLETIDKMGNFRKTTFHFPVKKVQDKIACHLGVEVWELFTESPGESEISGFIKAKGTIYEIKSRQDIENLLKSIQ